MTLLFWVVFPVAYLIGWAVRADHGKLTRELVWWYGQSWYRCVSLFVPITLRVDEKPPEPCILVLNHQSFFDTYCMGAQPIHDVVMVVRDWPFRIPFYAPVMRRGEYINSEKADPEEMLRLAKKHLGQGRSLMIFPEGTRSKTGKMGRFKSGAFWLAKETGVPVVPYCINGTGKLLPPGRWLFAPARITLRLLPAIDSRPYANSEDGHLRLKRKVKKAMTTAIGEK